MRNAAFRQQAGAICFWIVIKDGAGASWAGWVGEGGGGVSL